MILVKYMQQWKEIFGPGHSKYRSLIKSPWAVKTPEPILVMWATCFIVTSAKKHLVPKYHWENTSLKFMSRRTKNLPVNCATKRLCMKPRWRCTLKLTEVFTHTRVNSAAKDLPVNKIWLGMLHLYTRGKCCFIVHSAIWDSTTKVTSKCIWRRCTLDKHLLFQFRCKSFIASESCGYEMYFTGFVLGSSVFVLFDWFDQKVPIWKRKFYGC